MQREVKTDKLKRILNVFEKFEPAGFVKDFVIAESSYIRQKYEWHSSYYDDEKELIDILTALNELTKLNEEQMEWDFSALVFHDSKRFGFIRKKVVAIIRKFGKPDYRFGRFEFRVFAKRPNDKRN